MSEIHAEVKQLQAPQDAIQAYCCMNEVPTPWPEAVCICQDWVGQNLGRYVEGYHLQLGSGEVVGHLYYSLSERALFPYTVEAGVAILYCEWIQRRYQGQGLGKQLFTTFLDAMLQAGAKGILVEGTDIEGQMHAWHYMGRGFKIIHSGDHTHLLYLPLTQAEVQFSPVEPRIHPYTKVPVEILILKGYLCPYEVATQVLIRQIAVEFGPRVSIQELWLSPQTLQQYGTSRGIFINGRQKLVGGEPEEAIRQAILEEM
jgi:GNAT superfamily N-acetyltransferase